MSRRGSPLRFALAVPGDPWLAWEPASGESWPLASLSSDPGGRWAVYYIRQHAEQLPALALRVLADAPRAEVYMPRGRLARLDGEGTPWLGLRWGGGRGGRVSVFPLSVTGQDRPDLDAAAAWLAERADVCRGAGWEERATAASMARGMFAKHVRAHFAVAKGERPWLAQLPPRIRVAAERAAYGGPMGVMRGGLDDAAHIDRNAAFLHALRLDFPHPRAWKLCRRPRGMASRLSSAMSKGFAVLSDVTVSYRGDDALGALPARVNVAGGWEQVITYPRGKWRGWYTGHALEGALERGAHIDTVHEVLVNRERAPLADGIREELARHVGLGGASKRVAGAIYKRMWGTWFGEGGLRGRRGGRGDGRRLQGWPAWVRFSSTGPWREGAGGNREAFDYHPEWAALVLADNHREVARVASFFRLGEVAGAHVDALWVDASALADQLRGPVSVMARLPEPFKGWKVERVGGLRFYGVGAYVHCARLGDDKHGMMGAHGASDAGVFEARAWGSSVKLWPGMEWPEGSPALHEFTTGLPLESPATADTVRLGPRDASWTYGGWWKATADPTTNGGAK